jgi:two-component system, OmpR family, sensor kinase
VSLRSQVGLGVALLALLVVASSAGLAYGWFVRDQSAELRRLLLEDVARVAALLDAPVLGAAFVDPATPGFAVQVVGADGRVALAWGRDEPLPLAPEPALVRLDGRRHLIASAPWRGAGGTIRVAHDIEAAMRTRGDLARSLAWGGALAFLSSTLVALVVVRRALRPLEVVAERARAVDPQAPEAIAYPGSSQEVRALTDALNATLTAIRERSRRERDFLLEIAHELAAPLTLVNYHLAALRRQRPADGELRSAADAAQELLHTSQDLLVLARGELERPLDLALVDLRELLERVAGEYPGVRCEAPGPAQVIGDADRLMQVVRNLVRNGVQAAGRPQGVRVTLEAGPEEHRLRVEDDGPGLDAEALARVFERGFRRGRGSGVGLTISKDLVGQHDGSITAASGGGGGACFEVRLPSLASRVEVESAGREADDAGRVAHGGDGEP